MGHAVTIKYISMLKLCKINKINHAYVLIWEIICIYIIKLCTQFNFSGGLSLTARLLYGV